MIEAPHDQDEPEQGDQRVETSIGVGAELLDHAPARAGKLAKT